MPKALIVFLAAICFSSNSYATNVSGLINSNTTWTKANSPYIVTGDIAVDTGALLTIEPGVEVRFDGYYVMFIDGMLYAKGTATDSIKFTTNKNIPNQDEWVGIDVRHVGLTDTVVFDYCYIKHAYTAVRLRECNAIISNSTLDHGYNGVVHSSNYKTLLIVKNSKVVHNTYGLYVGTNSIVTDNEIGHNIWGYQAFSRGKDNYFANNFLYYNRYAVEAGGTIAYNIVVHSSEIGIHNKGSAQDSVVYNQVWYNKIGLDTETGIIEHNGLRYNETGIRYIGKDASTVRNNCIEKNTSHNLLAGVYPFAVPGNYWGTTDSTTITNGIFDFNDDFKCGKVSFMPVLQAADSGCVDSIDLSSIHTAVLSIEKTADVKFYPNPVNTGFTVETQQPHTLQSVEVYSLTGQQVLNFQVNGAKATIDAVILPQGMYLYKVFLDDRKVIVGRFLKK